jgi:predicted transcriptional regulator
MASIGDIATSAPTLDHQTDTFDAIKELIILGEDYAFVKKNDQIIGIVCVDNLLDEYNSATICEVNVEKFAEPLLYINEDENELKAAQLILENNVKHIAVTNQVGDFVGIVSFKQLKAEFWLTKV